MIKGIRILAALIVVLGAVFFVMGRNESGKFSNRFKKEVLGKHPKKANLYTYGGVALFVVGVGVLAGSFYKKHKKRK